jgi:hypothetical protein
MLMLWLLLQAADRAGAFQVLQGSLSLVNTSLTNNTASSAAGGILLQDGATLSCKQCILEGNRAAAGAAVAAESAALQLERTSVVRNTAPADLVSVSTAAGQQPAGSGAGIWAHSSLVKLIDSKFDFNSADLQGGAIHAINSSITGAGSSFVGNLAQRLEESAANLQDTAGGAIHVSLGLAPGSLRLRLCKLSSNVAGSGGAIAISQQDTSSQQGGASDLPAAVGRKLQQAQQRKQHASAANPDSGQHKLFVLLEDTQLLNNSASAGFGGGLYSNIPGVFFNFTNSKFGGNTAIQSGGGIALQNPASLHMLGTSMASNAASSCGGLLLSHPESASAIIRTTFSDNVAAGTAARQARAGAASISSTADSSLGQLPGYNSSGSGGGLCVVLAGTPVAVKGSIITGNTALHGGELGSLQDNLPCSAYSALTTKGCPKQGRWDLHAAPAILFDTRCTACDVTAVHASKASDVSLGCAQSFVPLLLLAARSRDVCSGQLPLSHRDRAQYLLCCCGQPQHPYP